MIRILLLLSLCVSAFGQLSRSPEIVTNYTELAARVPTSRIVVMGATNGSIVFAYFADATDATNASTTSPIIKPNNANGRWFGMKIGSGGGSGDMLAANNLSELTATSTARANINGGAETAYSSAWNGQSQFASRNAVYDKIEALQVANIQALRDLDATTLAHKYVWVGGYYSRGDGGGGMFEWVSGSSNSTNRGTCFQATAGGTGRWLKSNFLGGSFSVKEFGAKGDGTTDDSAAITDAAGQVLAGGSLEFPAGTYAMATRLLATKSNWKIKGNGTLKATAWMISVIGIQSSTNVTFEDITIDANLLSQYGIHQQNGKGFRYSGVRIRNWNIDNTLDSGGTAISAGINISDGSANTIISSCTLSNGLFNATGSVSRAARGIQINGFGWATSANDMYDFQIIGNRFSQIIGDGAGDGDCVSVQYPNGTRQWGAIVQGNVFDEFHHRGIKLYGDGMSAIGNYFYTTQTNVYAAISSYGSRQIIADNVIIGQLYRGIDATSTSAGVGSFADTVNIDNNIIIATWSNTNASQGIALEGAVTNCFVRGNNIKNFKFGIFAGGDVYQTKIADNKINSSGDYGIAVSTNASVSTYPTDLLITRNDIYGAGLNGIFVGPATNVAARFNNGTSTGAFLNWGATSGEHYGNGSTDTTGTGNLVLSGSPTLTTPTLGVASATGRAYNATTWNGSSRVPTEDDIRDELELKAYLTAFDTIAELNAILTDGDVATINGSETLANKTLTTPVIGSFANANHNHQNSAGGGTLDGAAIASGTIAKARGGLAADNSNGISVSGTNVTVVGGGAFDNGTFTNGLNIGARQFGSSTTYGSTVDVGWTTTNNANGSYRLSYPASGLSGLVEFLFNGTNVTMVARTNVLVIAPGDETTAITTGNAKMTFRAPHSMTIVGVRASLSTASSSGIPTFDINEAGTTILSTKLTIDASELTSTTAATAAVISDTAIADDAEITVDFDVAGTGSKGPKIEIYYTRP
jgi:hypothetical protein